MEISSSVAGDVYSGARLRRALRWQRVTEEKNHYDSQFTSEYKFKIAIHPVFQGLFAIGARSGKDWADPQALFS